MQISMKLRTATGVSSVNDRPLCTLWMLLWRLSLVFNYQARSDATAANLRSLFRGQKLLTVGYALPEMPLSVGSKLEALSPVYFHRSTHALVWYYVDYRV